MDRDMEKSGSSAHFSKRTGYMPWFFKMSAGTKLNCAFNNSDINSKNAIKNANFAFFKGYIYTRGISPVSIINAPKTRPIVRKTTKFKSKYLNVCLIYGKH